MLNAQDFADRYVALWNETDADARRRAIAEFFAPHVEHYVGAREVKGHVALEERIIGSHQKNVRDGGYRFRAQPNAKQLKDVVTFNWEMVPANGPESVVAVGLEFVTVDEMGRALVDFQFILP